MHNSIPVYELAVEVQEAYIIRREQARLLPTYQEQRSALLKAVDQYITSLEFLDYTIELFDCDNAYMHGEEILCQH